MKNVLLHKASKKDGLRNMPKGIRNLQVSFGETSLTHFGGAFLIHWFCKKLKIKWILQSYVKLPQRNNRYTPAELILSIIYTIILGLARISSTRILQYNGPFQNIIGLKKFPAVTTLRRFLLRLPPKVLGQIISVHDSFRKKMLQYPKPITRPILNLDSSVLTVYGRKIERAKVGYNPHKRGRASYQALICHEGHTRDNIAGQLHPGDMTTRKATISIEFLKNCLSKLPKPIYSIRVRGDGGFFSGQFIEFLDGKNIGYVIVAPTTSPIKRSLPSLKYRNFRRHLEVAEFYYQPMTHAHTKWKKPHRFVVIRRPISEEPTQQLTLFKLGKYMYRVFVTNLSLKPENIWRFYNYRAIIENIIKELKLDFALSKIPAKKFLVNQTYFHLLLFSYNIINWFRRLCLPKEFQHATLETIRTDLLVLPAKLVKSGSKNILKMPSGYIYQSLYKHVIDKIEKMEIV